MRLVGETARPAAGPGVFAQAGFDLGDQPGAAGTPPRAAGPAGVRGEGGGSETVHLMRGFGTTLLELRAEYSAMAHISVDLNDVVVHLTALEAVATWRRSVRVPISALRMVHVEELPLAGLSLWRLPGLACPGVFVLGSRRHRGQREFAAVRARRPAVVLDAEGAAWDRVVVSDADAVETAAELASLLLGRAPGQGHRATG